MEANIDKKFYVPSIEEFHVGFEFEVYNSKEHFFFEAGEGWMKTQMDYGVLGSVVNLHKLVIDKQVRVKHLDREDIESLGFEKVECPDGIFKDVFQRKETYNTKYVYNLYMNIDNRVGFTAIMERFRHEGENKEFMGERGNRFRGTIKNKSELKRILKQIGCLD